MIHMLPWWRKKQALDALPEMWKTLENAREELRYTISQVRGLRDRGMVLPEDVVQAAAWLDTITHAEQYTGYIPILNGSVTQQITLAQHRLEHSKEEEQKWRRVWSATHQDPSTQRELESLGVDVARRRDDAYAHMNSTADVARQQATWLGELEQLADHAPALRDHLEEDLRRLARYVTILEEAAGLLARLSGEVSAIIEITHNPESDADGLELNAQLHIHVSGQEIATGPCVYLGQTRVMSESALRDMIEAEGDDLCAIDDFPDAHRLLSDAEIRWLSENPLR